jgi:arylsulfatase A-like enzyme
MLGLDAYNPIASRMTYNKINLALDKLVNNLTITLKELGYYDNSIIIVTSDNGGCFQSGGSNYPLRGTKHYLFEGKDPRPLHQ